MKKLKQYIIEKQNFLIKNKNALKNYDHYEYHPKTCKECINIIVDLLKKGITDLNYIDVSKVTNMSWLFYSVNNKITVLDIDISEWNVSNVTSMEGMFNGCDKFNSDLSNWDVSNVVSTCGMFRGCKEFNSDLSNWNVSKVKDMSGMFHGCTTFNSDLSNWDVSNVHFFSSIFYKCINFDSNLSNWNILETAWQGDAFTGCDTLEKNNNIPAWYSN